MTGRLTGSNAARRSIIFSKVLLSAAPLCAIVYAPSQKVSTTNLSQKRVRQSERRKRSDELAGEFQGIAENLRGMCWRYYHAPFSSSNAQRSCECRRLMREGARR